MHRGSLFFPELLLELFLELLEELQWKFATVKKIVLGTFFHWNQIFQKLLQLCKWLVLILVWLIVQLFYILNDFFVSHVRGIIWVWNTSHWQEKILVTSFFPFADISKSYFLVYNLHRNQLDTMSRDCCWYAALEKVMYTQRINVLELNWG